MKKVAVITGGSRGIGAATALKAAATGYAVCVNFHRSEGRAEEIVRRIVEAGGEAIAVRADVAREAEVEQLFREVDDRLGPVRALVNNAGIVEKQTKVAKVSADRIRRILEANVVGTILCAREAVRRMSTEAGGAGGSIVNVSSAASRLGSPGEYVDYAASKGAVDAFTIGLAKEVGPEGIRVNAVRPAFIYTEIHADGGEPGRVDRVSPHIPMRRGGQPEEVADAIVWLLSDDASYVTGSLVDMAGGV